MAAAIVAAVVLLPVAILTQDMQPVLDLPTLAQGQVISSTAKHQARRSAARQSSGPTADQVEACAGLPRYRREYGAKHPEVRQLERLCRSVGL